MLLAGSVALLASCNRDIEEFRFKGTVIGGMLCSPSQVSYLIAVSAPDSIGDTVTVNDVHYKNVVRAYQASRKLSKDEVVYGVACMTKNYALSNCFDVFYTDLPEMILLGVDEEEWKQVNHKERATSR